MSAEDDIPTTYRVSVVNRDGEVFKRTSTKRHSSELLWHDVDGASHVLFAAFFVNGRLERQYVRTTEGR